jgi:nitrite reductase/ring-hydroxylating ferredoxin subunit
MGGNLVYTHGSGVGRHRRRGADVVSIETSRSEVTGGFVRVLLASELRSGESICVDVGGVRIMLVNLGDRVVAVQEFCTHRYGPLAHGVIADRKVTCPWHRSCFDLDSGAVIHGPAQAPLRTYAVDIKDDWICVRLDL